MARAEVAQDQTGLVEAMAVDILTKGVVYPTELDLRVVAVAAPQEEVEAQGALQNRWLGRRAQLTPSSTSSTELCAFRRINKINLLSEPSSSRPRDAVQY